MLNRLAFPATVFPPDFRQIICKQTAFVPSGRYNALSCFMCRQLPAFCNTVIVTMLAIVFLQLCAAPQIVFKCRLQFYKRFCPVTQLRFIQIPALHGDQVTFHNLFTGRNFHKDKGYVTDIRNLMDGIFRNFHAVVAAVFFFHSSQHDSCTPADDDPVLRPSRMLVSINRTPLCQHNLPHNVLTRRRQNLISAPRLIDHLSHVKVALQCGIFPPQIL